MVAASGVRTLTKVKFNNSNILVVAISVGVAMLTEASLSYTNDAGQDIALDLYGRFPDWFQTIFHSGISAGALTARRRGEGPGCRGRPRGVRLP